ncbi:hypothetical protein RF679_05340 [Undibacterium cyanobacteriorum]|uniref:DUF4476 domain-containing protein n=1 Tax=Undibacterium cyanobacteriorum TaxID=3073561 RepID=A0ABY9RKG3_9BURK|nr:hypothetical protein [Undibacterium sp. 20NA77.5]WMW81704.1 hypothetical protein RF679_05340 [Undibacterium sp. 20NA77.5]
MLRYAIILIALALPFSNTQAQSKLGNFKDNTSLPSDAYGKVIQSLIDVTNSGNPEEIKKFLLANTTKDFLEALPLQEHIGRIAGFGQAHGGCDFYALRESAATASDSDLRQLIVKGRASGDWFEVMLSFEGNQAPKIANMAAKEIPPAVK